ncbi:MAG: hypothetical protein IV090_26970 [Candidatus Sericytochromatia bacterium]|nr:hypothetical protein [Candidatus Sericytochromatia bacterium]
MRHFSLSLHLLTLVFLGGFTACASGLTPIAEPAKGAATGLHPATETAQPSPLSASKSNVPSRLQPRASSLPSSLPQLSVLPTPLSGFTSPSPTASAPVNDFCLNSRVTGKLLDSSAQPIAGAKLSMQILNPDFRSICPAETAETGPSGDYVLKAPGGALVELSIVKKGFQTLNTAVGLQAGISRGNQFDFTLQPEVPMSQMRFPQLEFTQVSQLPADLAVRHVTALQGQLYIFTDQHFEDQTVKALAGDVYKLDPTKPVLTPKGNLRSSLSVFFDLKPNLGTLVAGNEQLYLVGANTGVTNAFDYTQMIQLQPDTWHATQIGALPTARLTSLVAALGQIYAIGGQALGSSSSGNYLDEILAFQPSSGQFRVVGKLPSPRRGMAVLEIKGKLYAIGGQTQQFKETETRYPYLDAILAIEPETGKITQIGQLPLPMGGGYNQQWAVAIHDAIYLIGGVSETENGQLIYHNQILRIDPQTGESQRVGELPRGVYAPGVASLNNCLYLAGGLDGPKEIFVSSEIR